MGGGGSTTHIVQTIVYVKADPQLLANLKQFQNKTVGLRQQIQQLDIDLQKLKSDAKKLNDPILYNKYRQQAFDKFVNHLQTYNFKKPIIKQNIYQKHHILIGNISSGKSSLLNKLFGLNQKIGIGECTPKLKKVTKIGNVHIYDSPGMNDDFKIYDPDVLAFFHCADKIFILYPQSLKCCDEIVKILTKIKPNQTYLIRTQTDKWNNKMKKTIQQQIQTDKAQLAKWKIKLPIFATSSQKGLDYLDNLAVKNLIQNP